MPRGFLPDLLLCIGARLLCSWYIATACPTPIFFLLLPVVALSLVPVLLSVLLLAPILLPLLIFTSFRAGKRPTRTKVRAFPSAHAFLPGTADTFTQHQTSNSSMRSSPLANLFIPPSRRESVFRPTRCFWPLKKSSRAMASTWKTSRPTSPDSSLRSEGSDLGTRSATSSSRF